MQEEENVSRLPRYFSSVSRNSLMGYSLLFLLEKERFSLERWGEMTDW
jgi:hypothetical protein